MITLPNILSAVTADEAALLVQLATGKDVLELGCDYGFSAVVMGRVAHHVDTVDQFLYEGHESAEHVARTNFSLEGVGATVNLHVGDFTDVVPGLNRTWDLVFVDGMHDFANVRRDAELALSVLRADGVIAFHDYGRFETAEAVEDFVAAHKLRIVVIVDTLAVVAR